MIHVYIAGPLTTGCFTQPTGVFDLYRWESNVRKAEDLQRAVQLAGFAAYCPHTQNRYLFGHISEPVALEECFAWVRRCDAIALVEGWEYSSGTKQELELARNIGIMVFGDKSPFQGAARTQDLIEQLLVWSATRVTQPIDLPIKEMP